MKIKARARRRGYWLAHRLLPYSLLGDRIFAFYDFVAKLERLPRRRPLFNDYLYQLKQSGELLSLPRQIISDKELCKLLVGDVIGPGRTIPTLAILRDKAEIEQYHFPEDCVIKATHASGKTIIRRNGAPLDRGEISGFLDYSLYRSRREMNYKYLEPKIIVEPVVFDGEMIELKVHCYRGRARIISVQTQEQEAFERVDRDWKRLDMQQKRPLPEVPAPRPQCLDAVLDAAETLSKRFEYIRVDFYVRDADWLVGELTNCHMNIGPFKDIAQEKVFSEILFA